MEVVDSGCCWVVVGGCMYGKLGLVVDFDVVLMNGGLVIDDWVIVV